MKIKNLLLAGLAVFAMSACSNEDKNLPEFKGGDVNLKISTPQTLTRAVDTEVTGNPTSAITSIQVVYLDANKKVVNSAVLTDNDVLQAMKGRDGYILTKVPSSVASIFVAANAINNTKVVVGSTLNDVKKHLMGSEFIAIQPISDGIGSGISKSPLFGESGAFVDTNKTNPETTNKIYSARVSLKSEIARVQILGTVEYSQEISEGKVQLLALDNFLQEYEMYNNKFALGSPQDSEVWNTYKTANKGYDKIFDYSATGKLDDGNKVYAYHVYPQKADETADRKEKNIKLIIKHSFKYENETKIRYSTLRLATGTKEVIDPTALNIEGGKIYKIDLGLVDWDGDGSTGPFNPGDGDETPNAGQKDVQVLVEVVAWDEVTTFPQN